MDLISSSVRCYSQDAYDKYTENEVSATLGVSRGVYGGGSETLILASGKAVTGTLDTAMGNRNGFQEMASGNFTILGGAMETIRRLTPTECARLQGFPDWWCDDLGEEPTDEEVDKWLDIFNTHSLVVNGKKTGRTRSQIIKWLRDPHTDSAEYKMWGNGVALPCVDYIMTGIAYWSQKEVEEPQEARQMTIAEWLEGGNE